MKKLLSLLVILTVSCTSKVERVYVAPVRIVAEDVKAFSDWDCFTFSVAMVESEWDEFAVNGDNVGFLQIRPIMVREANRILGFDCFSLEDRLDYQGSIAIWNVVQDYRNPEHDFELALKIWNNGHPKDYSERIMNIYQEIIGGNIEIPFSALSSY